MAVVVIVVLAMREPPKKTTLEDDSLCTSNLASATSLIENSRWTDARMYLSAAKVACGTARAAEYEAARKQLDDAEAAREDLKAQMIAAVVKEHQDAAARVWAAYDALPAGKKSKLDLLSAMTEAKSHEAGLPAEVAPSVTRYNAKQARLRMAPLINPESRAEGERAEILVPSQDRTKCVLWGSGWSNNVESLQTIGFESIRCAASSYKSHLTGEMVVEPERVWNVPPP